VTLPAQLLLSDLLRRRVRCDQGLDHGPGTAAWMHPPVHRLLGWVCRPSALGSRRRVWRLNQLRGLAELEVLVQGDPAETDQATVERLPTLLNATLVGHGDEPLGTLVDAAVELRTGLIHHYLVSRSDPRLPGSSRWRLTPDRIMDQRSGEVRTTLQGLDDLPLARASVRQELLRRSRRWREQMQEETSRLRDQFQQVGDRFDDRLEGWLEEPPWEPGDDLPPRSQVPGDEPWDADDWQPEPPPPERRRREGFRDGPPEDGRDDPWI
jgi:hypothetical protein